MVKAKKVAESAPEASVPAPTTQQSTPSTASGISTEDVAKVVSYFQKKRNGGDNPVIAAIKKGYLHVEILKQLSRSADDLHGAAKAYIKAPVVLILLHEAGWEPLMEDLEDAATQKLYGTVEVLASWLTSAQIDENCFVDLVIKTQDEQIARALIPQLPLWRAYTLNDETVPNAPDLLLTAIQNRWSFPTVRLIVDKGGRVTAEALAAAVAVKAEDWPDAVGVTFVAFLLSHAHTSAIIPVSDESLKDANPMVAFMCKEIAARRAAEEAVEQPEPEVAEVDDLPPPVPFTIGE